MNIIESFNIQSKPTWDINVTSKALKFKAEWDIVNQNLSNIPTDIFPRSIIETIGTYSLVNSAWNTSFNGQKLCIKLEWKIQNTDSINIHDSPIYNTSHTPFIPGFSNSPNNHSFVSTPTTFSSSKPPPDSGYKSQSDSYKNSPKYYSNRSRNVNIESKFENSPSPRAKLPNSPHSPVNRQDLYRPQPNKSSVTDSALNNSKKSDNMSNLSRSKQHSPSNATANIPNPKIPINDPHKQESSSNIPCLSTSSSDPYNQESQTSPIKNKDHPIHDIKIDPNISNGNVIHAIHEASTTPRKSPDFTLNSACDPQNKESSSRLNDSEQPIHDIKSVPKSINVTPEASINQKSPADSPNTAQPIHDKSEPSINTNQSIHEKMIDCQPNIDPPSTKAPSPGSPPTTITAVHTSSDTKLSVISSQPVENSAAQPHSTTETNSKPETLSQIPPFNPSKSRKKNKKNKVKSTPQSTKPPDPPPTNIIPTPRNFIISSKSKDGAIITECDPTSPNYLPQDECFEDTPSPLPIGPNGCLDTNLHADRMKIPGKCRLCNQKVYSYNADYHLLGCREIPQADIGELIDKYANNKYHYGNINDIIYDYYQFVLHDGPISSIFRKVDLFQAFLNDMHCMLDRKASYIFKKTDLFGQHPRFNILNYLL